MCQYLFSLHKKPVLKLTHFLEKSAGKPWEDVWPFLLIIGQKVETFIFQKSRVNNRPVLAPDSTFGEGDFIE